MKNLMRIALLVLVIAALTACGGSSANEPTAAPAALEVATATEQPTAAPAAIAATTGNREFPSRRQQKPRQ